MARVLLVDDDAAINHLARSCLTEELGTTLFGEARDADEALQALRAASWDVVLLDLRLPRTNGLVTLGWLKRLQPEVPILVVTDLPAAQYEAAAVRAGAAGFLTKAEARFRLAGFVRALLAARARARAAS